LKERRIRRGDIFYVSVPTPFGGEMKKDRPAIVVSRDDLNDRRSCVTVVYLSCTPKMDLPEHISIGSAARPCKAITEYLDTVDKSRLGKRIGRCTSSEMRMVSSGIASSLDIAEISPLPDDTMTNTNEVANPENLIQKVS